MKSRKLASQVHRIVVLILLISPTLTYAWEPIQLLAMKTHSRLVFPLSVAMQDPMDPLTAVKIKNDRTGFTLFFPGLSLSDLGSPVGEEDQWKKQLQSIQDSRLTKIEVHETPEGVTVRGLWKFPSGKLELARPEMDTFHYFDRNQSRFVFDFWTKAGPTLSEVKWLERRRKFQEEVRKARREQKRKQDRLVAFENEHQHHDKVDRFCERPLSESSDTFLEFFPAHHEVDFLRWFPISTADAKYEYSKVVGHTRDAQYARLAMKFYTQGKYALVLRTLDFLDTEYPKSSFRPEMKFLRGNALLKLGYKADGEKLFKQVIDEYKNIPASLHAAMYLTAQFLEKKSYLAALENFLWMVQHHSSNPLAWVFHLGAAECFYAMKETVKGAQEYRWIIDNGPSRVEKAEAAFRLGDLYLQRFQYEQALAAYFQASNYYADQAHRFPNYYLNRGEALYQLEQYDRAAEIYKQFLKDYPSYPRGWRASFRLGEIYGRSTAAKEPFPEARKWFYETVNHYPFSPGATLGRLRLLPCADHGGFTLETASRFFSDEAKKFDGDGEIFMSNYADLKGLAHVRALISLGGKSETIDAAIDELRTTRSSIVRRNLSQVAHDVMRKLVTDYLNQGQKYQAIKLYTDKYPDMPAEGIGPNPNYLLLLSKSAADLGLGELAKDLAEEYSDALIRGHHQTAGKTSSDPELQLSEQKFVEAKAHWIAQLNSQVNNKVHDKNSTIKELLEQVREESPYTYEKEIILGLIAEEEKNIPSALTHVSKAQLMRSGKSTNLAVDAWLASLQSKSGDPNAALAIYSNLEKKIALAEHLKKEKKTEEKEEKESALELSPEEILGIPLPPSLEAIALKKGEIYEKLGRWGEAAAAYSTAIKNGVDGNQIRFEYARSLFKSGSPDEIQKAVKVLEEIVNQEPRKPIGEKEEFWKKLAQETLANEQSKIQLIGKAKEGKK